MTRFLFAIGIFIASHAGASAKFYTNTEYGFKAEMPRGKPVCLPEEHQSNHGFVVLWEKKECPPARDVSGIYVYFGMNAFESHSTLEVGQHTCGGNAITPGPFWVSGFQFYKCKSRTDSGRVSLDFFVLRRVQGGYPEGESTYGVSLLCPHDDCRNLLPMTRWIFAHMKFIRQE